MTQLKLLDNVGRMIKEYGRFDNLDNPSISVIVPSYNEAGSGNLGRALLSIINQSYKADQIIVVDDGSKDKTSEIAKGYDGVEVYKTENKGVSHARNYGAEKATGDILVFIDSDSFMDAGLLREVADSIGKRHYEGGTGHTNPDSNGATESLIYGAGNIVAKVTNMVGGTKRLTPGGFIYCSREGAEKIREKYGVLFKDGTSEDRLFVNSLDLVERLDVGITASARRERKNGLVVSLWDQFQRSTTPAGIPHDGYEVIREDAALAA